ncbi:beta strand repeat-containing protein [Methylobacterium durans]|uniref:beta strand repeat-containing protein n=1 Tax=Methylobacterium durans TaxID=2202825 RepID=UPI001F1CAAA2|nr:hypothetical protein [Methylobacterium durans]
MTSTGGSVTVSATNHAAIEADSAMIGSSSVSGTVAALAKKAAETALTIYDYTTKSGTKDLKTGDRVRLAADYAVGTGANAAIAGRVYIFIGTSRSVNLGTSNYGDTTLWFAVAEGASVVTKPAPAGTTATTTNTTTNAAGTAETTTVTTPEGTTSVTRLKARYSSLDGYQFMRTGQTVRFSPNDTNTKGVAGTIYIYRGPDNAKVTLQGEDYLSDNWIPAPARTVLPALDKVADPAPPATPATPPASGTTAPTARTPASSSKAFGGLIVFNEVNGGASARITDATVTAHADLSVLAKDAADIAATIVSTVTASGGASFQAKTGTAGTTSGGAGGGTLIAANGIAATNVVRGGAGASVLRSTIEATTGDLAVEAENEAGVDARLRAASTTSGGTEGGVSAAVTLAFNSVGYETQNLLFNTIDALIGSPTLSNAFGGEVGSGAKATIVQSSAKAGGDLTVAATSSAKINATISNAALSSTDSMKGSGGTGFGLVLSSNKVSGSALARIDNTGATGRTVEAGGALSVTAQDAAGITSNAQIVTSSTVVKTDGGAVTNQSKLNKFLPSDFSTNPNETQSATLQSNLIKNRKDLLPAEVTALEDKIAAQVERVKQLVIEARSQVERATASLERAQAELKAKSDAATQLRAVYKALTDAMEALADPANTKIPANDTTTLRARLLAAADELKKVAATDILKPETDALRDAAYRVAAEAAARGYLDDAALRKSSNAAQKAVGDTIGRVVGIEKLTLAAGEKIVALKEGLDAFLKPLGISTADFVTLDFTALGQPPKTANLQTVTFGTRVRIADGYAKPTYQITTTERVTIKTGDTIQTADGAVYKYVAAATLTDKQPSTVDVIAKTAGKADWVKIASKASDYKAGDIYVYMGASTNPDGTPVKIDLAATDFTDKLLWKRALDSNFIPDGLKLPGTTSTGTGTGTPAMPAAPAAATPATTTDAPTGDPSAANPGAAQPQSAAALAIGGLVVLNSVHGDATAQIVATTATSGTGAITVSAKETATITATADSAATVKSASSYKPTNGQPAPAAGSTPTADPAAGTPAIGTKTQTKSLALGGVIATNSVLGAADAAILDSTVTGGGGLSVTADNTATIQATNKTATSSDQGAVSITLAFNTIGWKEQNVLFRAADTITGQPLIAQGLNNDDTPSGATARVLRTGVATGAGSALTVSATSSATIEAKITNKASAANAVLKDASAYAVGVALTGNMVNARALATLDNSTTAKTVDAGGAITISATGAGRIDSQNSLSSLASLTKPSVLEDFANKILDDYTYTTKSGTKTVKFGDIVFAKENGQEKRYVYFGATKSVNLATEIFSEANSWRENNLKEFVKFLPPGVLNLGESKDTGGSATAPAQGSTSAGSTAASKPYAAAASGILVSNDVRSTAAASLVNAAVIQAGDVAVTAAQTGSIGTSVTSKVESKLKPGTKPGTKESVAIGAVIAANVVTGSSLATITGSKLGDAATGKTVGNVTVEARNTGSIKATVDSTVESSGTAVGVTAAFNKIGTSSQNVLFDLSDAILGTDLGTVIQGANTFEATASISGQPINATGTVTVAAQSKATIDARIENAVTTVGAQVTSVGAVVALNFARLSTSATIADVASLRAAGGVAVSATSESRIDAVVTAPVTAVAYRMPPTDPASGGSTGGTSGGTTGGTGGTGTESGKTIAVALSVARNTIAEEALVAGIDRVGDLTASAGNVTVAAKSDATINAKATATAIAVLLSTEDGKNLGFAGGGALGFNTILGGVDAHIADSKITASGTLAPSQDGTGGSGGISVSARSDSDITAETAAAAAAVIVGKGASQAVAIGVTLAFNMIGFYGSGLPTGANFKDGTGRSLDVRASVARSRLTAGRKVAVEAESAESIIAKTTAAAVAVGVSTGGGSGGTDQNLALSGGGLYVGNKIVTATSAIIDGTGSTDDAVSSGAGGVTVAAKDKAIIRATSVALAVSANLSADSSNSSTKPTVSIGAALADNEIQSDVTARITQVANVSGSGAVSVSAAREAKIFAQTFAASVAAQVSSQGQGVAVAGGGALALNNVGGSTVAEILASKVGDGTTDAAKVGSLTVAASDIAEIAALTGATSIALAGTSGDKATGVAIGASVSNNVVGSAAAVRATLSGTPVRAAGAVSVSATSKETVDATTVAVSVGLSGSTSGSATSVSLGGSVARNVIDVATVAEIVNAGVIDAGSLSVTALNESGIKANVGAASIAAGLGQGGAITVALAASVALNSVTGNVSASVQNAQVTTRSGGVTVTADRKGRIETLAAAASVAVGVSSGGKGVGVSGAGVGAVNTINSSTTASVQGASIDAAGAVTVAASSLATIKADVVAAAASVGVSGGGSGGAGALGIAIAYNEIGRWTAYDAATNTISETPAMSSRADVSATLSNTSVAATGALAVTAASQNTITANIAAIAVGATVSSSNAVAFSIGGTFAMNNIGLATAALVDGDRTGTGIGLSAAGATVTAQDTSAISATALSASLALAASPSNAVSIAVGGSIALNSIANDVSAVVRNIDRTLQTSGAILVSAKSAGSIKANAASAAISIGAGASNGVAISAAITYARNVITTSTRAQAAESVLKTTGTGDVSVKAEASATIEAKILAAALAVGVGGSNGVGVGVGAAIAENRIGTWTPSGTDGSTSYALAINGGTVTEASLTRVAVDAKGALTVDALSKNAITADIAALSAALAGGGSNGVGVSAGATAVINAIGVSTRAFIEGNGVVGSAIASNAITAGAVTVQAQDTSSIVANALTAAVSASLGGTAGVSVSIGFALALNTINAAAQAYMQNVGNGVAAAGALLVNARNASTIRANTTAAAVSLGGGGTAGVAVAGGGAFAFNTIRSVTSAIVDASPITQSGSVTITAAGTSQIEARVLAASAAVALGGSAGVGVALGASAAANQIGGWTSTGTGKDRVDTAVDGQGSLVEARLRNGGVTTAGALKVEATSTQSITAQVAAAAASIGGGGAAGVGVSAAGVVVTNAIAVSTRATIDGAGTGITAGSITVNAADSSTIDAFAGSASLAGSGGGSAGVSVAVGFTIALNSIAGAVEASIANAAALIQTSAAGISVTASRAGRINAAAAAAAISLAGGGAAGVGVSGGGAFASNSIRGTVNATVDSSRITSAAGLTVTATATSQITAIVSAAAASGGGGGAAGVGVALGVGGAENRIGRWTTSGTDGNRKDTLAADAMAVEAAVKNATLDIAGALAVEATSNQTISATVVAAAAAIQGGGAAGVSGSGAGAVTANAIGVVTRATIDGDGTGGIQAGSVSVKASDTSAITAATGAAALSAAGGGAAGVSVAVGFALALNTIAGTVEAAIRNADTGLTTRSGGVSVSATSNGRIKAVSAAAALSVGGGGAAGVSVSSGGAGAANVITTKTNALVSGSTLTVRGGASSVTASATSDIQALIVAAAAAAGGGGAAGVGVSVGVGIAVNVIGAGNEVQASLGTTSADADGALSVTATARQTIKADVAAVSASVQGAGAAAVSVAGAGVGASNVIAVATRATIDGDGATGIRASAVSVTAQDNSEITATVAAAGIAGSGAGVAAVGVTIAASNATNTIGNAVEATIRNADTGLTATSGDVSVGATSGGFIKAVAAAATVSLGGAGIANVQISGGGASALNIITTRTRAAIEKATGQGANNKVTGAAAVRVTATSTQAIDANVTSLAVAGGGAGVASVPVAIGLAGAQNIIGDWQTKGSDGKNLAQPALRANGSAAVEAVISGTTVDAQGSVAVGATSASTINAIVAAGAAVATGATVGVGVAGSGSYSGNAISIATKASIEGATTRVTAGDVSVRAQDRAVISVDVGTAAIAAAGGAVGVGGAIGVATALNVIDSALTAQIDSAGVTTRTGGIAVEALVPSDDSATPGFEGSTINAKVAAASAALAGGGVGVAVSGGGAVATNLIGGSTRATLNNASLDAKTDVSVSAANSSRINAEVAAIAAGASIGGVAVAASIGTGVAINLIGTGSGSTSVPALAIEALSTNSGIKAGGNLAVQATSGQRIDASIKAGSVAVSGGAIGVSLAGSGAGTTNRVAAQVNAGIDGDGTGISAGDVTVAARDTSTLTVDTGAASIAASFGITGAPRSPSRSRRRAT